MTTIAWDGDAVYSDSQVTYGSAKGKAEKVFRLATPDGPILAAFCGERNIIHDCKLAIEAGLSITKIVGKASSVLVVGKHAAFQTSEGNTWRVDPPVFMGSGMDFAEGAYEICKDARKAVEVACRKDLYSSGPVRKYRLRK
jgi:hypothetical protein